MAAECLESRKPLPVDVTEGLEEASCDPTYWDPVKDAQIIQWSYMSPEDWCLGGKSSVYLWGSGRHGQLGEAGRTLLNPTHTTSFSSAKQVSSSIPLVDSYTHLHV